ncbi:arylsulfatase A family protein [Spirochaetia bacterium]|nr:arylsulfatase A family protein [Spirochaetia bacterium]
MKTKDRPNVVFVLTDDQGYWALGCNGNPDIITPNIDRLAAEGTRFENFFCVSPVCSPARASLLTGRIPSQHGVHDWLREGNTGKGAIEYLKGIRGYPQDLADSGYQCALSGKWHLGDSINPQMGFTRWYVHQRGGGNYYKAPMIKNGKLIEEEGYVTDAITDNAISFMREMARSPDPFYLSVHYTAPHSPWVNNNHPRELTGLYENCSFSSCPIQEPHPWAIFSTAPDAPTLQDVKYPQESLKGYYGAVTGVDRGVGRILEELENLDKLDNTLIIFAGDNGFNCGHHGIWGKGNGTFPINMYDTSVKVPFVIRHPARINAGTVVKEMVSAYDFMPTLLEYLDITRCEEEGVRLPGKSFVPLLTGRTTASGGEERPVVVFDEYGPVRMIRTGNDKYVIRYPYGPDEYYCLDKDPEENHNEIDNPLYADRIVSLKNQMEEWFIRYADPGIDGRFERVSGNGQVGLAGIKARGKKNYLELGHRLSVDV